MQKLESYAVNVESQLSLIIVGSIMLVAGLAWNDAIISAINYYIPESYRNNKNILYKFLYALSISMVAVIMISILSKLSKNKII